MLARRHLSPLLTSALIALAGVAETRAQLAVNSPFLPPQSAGAVGPTIGAPLENRGSIDRPGEGLQVRIYDPNRKIGAWLRINEHDPTCDFVVKQYDTSRDTATVEYAGRTLILPLREAKVTSAGMAPFVPMAQMPPPVMTAPGMASVNQSQVDAVAAAVAQRRALRVQAAQQNNQGVPPVPQPIQALPQVIRPAAPLQAQPQNQNQRGQPRGGINGPTGAAGRRGA